MDIVERLCKEANLWVGATHTVSGPRLADLLREAAVEIGRQKAYADKLHSERKWWLDEIGLIEEEAITKERERCAAVALEQRCERGTPWDDACVAIANAIKNAEGGQVRQIPAMKMMSVVDMFCEALQAVETHRLQNPNDHLRMAILERALDFARADLLRCWKEEEDKKKNT